MAKLVEEDEDFLEVDNPIPGQNFVCMSFLSPEEVLRNKEVFFVHKFLETVAKNYDLDKNTVQEKYKDFLYLNSDTLEKEFFKDNDYRTTMRGLKIRGTYDSLKEANIRAKVLQKKDKNFNVFVGQVGYWLPWDPPNEKIENQEYAEGELNTLMKEYKANIESKDQHFQENIDYVKEQAEKDKKLKIENEIETKLEENRLSDSLDFKKDDPWMDRVNNEKNEKED